MPGGDLRVLATTPSPPLSTIATIQHKTVARSLNERKVIGRFSTFLEHVKQLKTGEQVTKYNALFHWAVPKGREIDAGREVGRFHIMTHAYWREAGAEFGNVNVMGVAHPATAALPTSRSTLNEVIIPSPPARFNRPSQASPRLSPPPRAAPRWERSNTRMRR